MVSLSGVLIEGFLPTTELSAVREWAAQHVTELLINWGRCQRNEYRFKIEPLKQTSPAMPATLANLDACEITRARVTGDHQVAIRFRDGLVAELNLAAWIKAQSGPMIEPLRSPAFFADMGIEDGVLTWPNSYDLDPLAVRHWAEHGSCD